MGVNPEVESIHQWLKGFSAAVRARDYVLGRDFFADEVIGFGSVAQRCDGLENLEVNQWRKVWDATTGFEFDIDSTVVGVEAEMAWAASAWQSMGKTSLGDPMLRRGRSTFVFRKQNGQWLAVHSHFSLEPKA
jgi:ketosteroid isomerase-like protein